MALRTIADSPHPSTPETAPEYVLRGLGIFELNRDEILGSYQGGRDDSGEIVR